MTQDTSQEPRQAVAIIGGAVAGATLARMLSDQGIEVVVIEQNKRPFGKIEDGLPRWHAALRSKEYAKIVDRLSTERIHFVPSTRVGADVEWPDLVKAWGLTAVVLACGAWRDRKLPFPEAEDLVGKGLLYQNPFIVAYNHAEDPDYEGPRYDVVDDGIVVGGGLASIDCAKVLMLETTRAELAKRGHEIDVESLEKAGLDKACEGFGLKWEDLGLKGCTLFYRREPEDMPLQAIPDGADEAKIAKVRGNRAKMLQRTMAKYRFRFEGLSSPEAALSEDGRCVGLVFRRMAKDDNGKLVKTDETVERRGNLVISSIGSVPAPIRGVEMKGELFAFTDWDLGRLDGLPNVFSCGNVVTGKGNIVASRRHATSVGDKMIGQYLGVDGAAQEGLTDDSAGQAAQDATDVAEKIARLPTLEAGALETIREKTKALQARVGYDGDLAGWVEKHPPA